MTRTHPDDVQLILTFAKDAAGNVVRVDIDAAHAATGDDLFRCSMTPGQYARMAASGVTRVRSSVRVPRPGTEPECGEDNTSAHGDCDGRVREYTVTAGSVCGQVRGEAILLCAGHATFHGRHIRRTAYVGGPR